MAWFKRNRDEAPASSDDALDSAAPEPAPEPAADTPPAPAAQPSAPAWMSAAPMPQVTPVIQRVLAGDARASTTLGKPAPLSLAPLGHAVTPDAPTGAVTAVAVADPDRHLPHDEPPLEYVQRAPVESAPARPAAPAQLLVPSFQPSRLPSLPPAPAEVQRAPATPSFTTAPAPEPPLVLPVGEILSAPGPGAGLPLAPVQRHADHPGHVDGDEAPDGVQRAPLDAAPAPAPARSPDAPLASAQPLTAPEPGTGELPAASGTAPAPAADLPLAPVQRHADHPGQVGADAAPEAVQRAPVDSSGPAPRPDAPLASGPPPIAPGPADGAPPAAAGVPAAPEADLPLAPVQRQADHPGQVGADAAPEIGAQRAPLDAPLASPVQRQADPPGQVGADAAPETGAQRAPLASPVQRQADPPGQVGADAAPEIGAQRAPLDAPLASANPLTVADPAAGAPPIPASAPQAPAVDLPLAPVQRAADHPDHPGHVDGDEAPDAAQRAPIDAPAPAPAAPDAPLVSANPLTAAEPATVAPQDPGTPPAPEVDLPLAPVQRAADHPDHPGHVDGDEAPDTAQRAPIDTPAPAAAVPDAPLVSANPLAGPGPAAGPLPAADSTPPAAEVDLPLAPVQRAADHPDHPGHVDGDEAPDTAQRAPIAAPAPAPAAPDAPLVSANPLTAAEPPTLARHDTATPAAPEVELPLAPVQRSADHPDHPGHVDGDEAPEGAQRAPIEAPGAPVTSAPLVGDAPPLTAPPGALPPAATETPAGPAAPAMPLPGAAVQRSATGRRPGGLGRPIPAVPPDAVEPGTVQRSPAPPVAPLTGAEPLQPAPALPLAAVQRAATEGEAGDEPEVASASGTEEGPSLDLAQRAPVDAPATTPVAPLVGTEPLAPAAADHLGPDPEAAPGTQAPPGAATPELDLVQRAPLGAGAGTPTTSAGSTASSSSSGTTPAAATTPRPPLVMAPLLGGRPFSTQVQRAADGGATAPSGLVDRTSPEALSPEPGRVYQPLAGIGMWNGAPPPDLPGPAIEAPPSHVAAAVQRALGTDVSNVRIRRDTGPTAQRLAARAFTHEGEVHIPASVGSLDSGEGASLATHELVHAGQQSVLGSSRPHEHTPEGQALEAHARSAEHASLAGLELPKLPLAPPQPPAVQRAPADGSSSSPFSPQQLNTLLSLADNPPPGATLQRELLADAPPRPDTPAPGGPPPRPSTPAPGGQTPQELEELATKLFPTLRNLFRSELLGFRRRTGTSSDRPLS